MQTLKLIPFIIILLLLSCSEANEKSSAQNKFNFGIENFKPENGEKLNVKHLQYADEENIINLLKEKEASFIIFGIASDDYSAFEKKYGIKVKTENCVVMTNISKLSIENNRIISKYLSQKFQDRWKSDLKIVPFGLN